MKKRNIYIFIRADGFYQLELENDAVAKANAENNPGTLRVKTPDGKIVWEQHGRYV